MAEYILDLMNHRKHGRHNKRQEEKKNEEKKKEEDVISFVDYSVNCQFGAMNSGIYMPKNYSISTNAVLTYAH